MTILKYLKYLKEIGLLGEILIVNPFLILSELF